MLTEDCIGSRKDVMAGGARYTGVGFNLGGIGTAVDALAAIQDVIYDKNMLTLEECVECRLYAAVYVSACTEIR